MIHQNIHRLYILHHCLNLTSDSILVHDTVADKKVNLSNLTIAIESFPLLFLLYSLPILSDALLILFIQHQDVTSSLIWAAQYIQHFLNVSLWILPFTDFCQLRFVDVNSRLQIVVADLPFIHILLFRLCLIIVFLLAELFFILDQWVRIAFFHLLPTLFFLILI